MASLPEDLESLLGGQPPVDWPGAVGAALARRQQRRLALAGLAALLVVAVVGTALVVGGDDPEPRQQAEQLGETPTPTPTATPTATPTLAPIAEITPEVVTLRPDLTCEPTPPPAGTLPTLRQRGAALPNDVDLRVVVSCTTIEVGAPFFVRATSTATQDKATQFSWTLSPDGLDEPQDNSGCTGEPAEGAGPGAVTTVLSSAFETPGVQRVTVQATTPDPCLAKPGGAAVTFEVTVVPVASATPTPSATPSPTPSPSATPSPTPPPTTTPPAPPVDEAPLLAIDSVTTSSTTAAPGSTVLFTVTVTSNVGRPQVTGTTNGVPPTPICPAGEAFPVRERRTFQIQIPVVMPQDSGNAIVDLLVEAPSGCLESGQALVDRSAFQIQVA